MKKRVVYIVESFATGILFYLVNMTNSLKDEYDFYNSHAVIIGDDDYFYHTYSCKYLDLRSFYIYNIENAKAQGYEPCPYCQ